MPGSLNKCMIIGNLGRDPEVRTTQDGTRVVNLAVATSESWTDKSGERQERTTWHTIVIWNERLGEVAEKYCRKGSKIYVEGQLQTRKWTDRDGNDRYSTEVVLGRFRGDLTLLDSRKSEGEEAAPSASSPRRAPAQTKVPMDDVDSDAIPF